ncbi:MAG: class I SAM-dependent methyltransferase [Methanospirillum sp.]|nr:class I SAM-dependent methyltransferase [Methanospirillum sp.]
MSSGDKQKRSHHHEVFSAEKAGHLDTRFRHFLYRPDRLAEMYVRPGDRVLDFGCGPGFFTREFAIRVGENGLVYSADLQDEMLKILTGKLAPLGLMERVRTHRCRPDSISLPADLNGTFDVAFAIFVVHEVPDPAKLFREIAALLKPGGTFFLTEPPYVISGSEFQNEIEQAVSAGFVPVKRLHYFVNRAVVLRKAGNESHPD